MNKQFVAMAAFGLLASACGPDAPDQRDMQPQADQPAARQDAADRTATQEGRVPPVPLPGGSTLRDTGTQMASRAKAGLQPTKGNSAHGSVTFIENGSGEVKIAGEIDGLKPGEHGFHIHKTGDCSAPDATSAGGHFAPNDNPHGSPDSASDEHHAGDLGNVKADDKGHVTVDIVAPDLGLSGNESIVGRALIVHGDPDDFESQPSGNAGPRVACGKIEYDAAGNKGANDAPEDREMNGTEDMPEPAPTTT